MKNMSSYRYSYFPLHKHFMSIRILECPKAKVLWGLSNIFNKNPDKIWLRQIIIYNKINMSVLFFVLLFSPQRKKCFYNIVICFMMCIYKLLVFTNLSYFLHNEMSSVCSF